MAGLFPVNGVIAQQTLNAQFPVATVEGCDALFYRANCKPVFDPVATNAIISELLNAINFAGDYDCTRLDNLAQTLRSVKDLCNLPNATIDQLSDPAWFAGCFDGDTMKLSFADLKNAIVDVCNWEAPEDVSLDDRLVGCFDGRRRAISLETLKDVLFRLCELPVASKALVPSDSVAGCFDGKNGRATMTQLSQILGSSGAFVMGGLIGTTNGVSAPVNVSGRTAFFVVATMQPGGSGGFAAVRFSMGGNQMSLVPYRAMPGSGGGSQQAVTVQDYSSPRVGENPRALLCIKKDGQWYLIDGSRAIPLGSTDQATCFTFVDNSALNVFTASPL